MVLDDGTATAIGIAIGLLIISGLVALWLRSCRNHQDRASQAAAGGSNNSGQPGFRSMCRAFYVFYSYYMHYTSGPFQKLISNISNFSASTFA